MVVICRTFGTHVIWIGRLSYLLQRIKHILNVNKFDRMFAHGQLVEPFGDGCNVLTLFEILERILLVAGQELFGNEALAVLYEA